MYQPAIHVAAGDASVAAAAQMPQDQQDSSYQPSFMLRALVRRSIEFDRSI